MNAWWTQLHGAPEYFSALKAAGAVCMSALPVYVGLLYFIRSRHLRAPLALPATFFGIFLLFAGLAFLFDSPLGGLLPVVLVKSYLFFTSIIGAFCITL